MKLGDIIAMMAVVVVVVVVVVMVALSKQQAVEIRTCGISR